MKLHKNMLAAGVVTTVAAGSLLGVSMASAQTSDGGTSIVDRIASTFNLNRDDVQNVFDEQRQERHEQMEQKHEEHLQQLVEDGTITSEQKDDLEAKHEEMRTLRESLKDQDLTREEMRNKMQEARSEFEAWAEDQGIDLESIRPEGKDGMRGRHGGMRGMHFESEDQES